jgi:aminopeptidase-like protein
MQPFEIDLDIGNKMYKWASDLFPINRSITGPGIKETLRYLKALLPELEIHSVKSGTQVFDWTVPNEWSIDSAYLEDESGKRIVDFSRHNLHVVGYSESVDVWLSFDELKPHLYSLSHQPSAIPYVTSYYERRWGFCLTHNQYKTMGPGKYHAVINSSLEPGELNYGELVIPGKTNKEIFLSTYICHPSMANNELSGPVVTTALAQYLINKDELYYTYRIIFIPETIGSIAYLSKNLKHLKDSVVSGFNVTCVGDNRAYSFLPSRKGDTLSDQAARHVLKHIDPKFKNYKYLSRGSDERQYCSPGVDLPIASIMRSKYGEYPEYHTSLDDLSVISPEGLSGGFEAILRAIEVIENNIILQSIIVCEPFFSKYKMRDTLGGGSLSVEATRMSNLSAYADGTKTLLDIAEIIGVPFWELIPIVNKMISHKILKAVF